MKKEIIIPDNIHKTRGYAHAVRVGYTLLSAVIILMSKPTKL